MPTLNPDTAATEEQVLRQIADDPASVPPEEQHGVIATMANWILDFTGIRKGADAPTEEEETPASPSAPNSTGTTGPAPDAVPDPSEGGAPAPAPLPPGVKKPKTPLSSAKAAGDLASALSGTGVKNAANADVDTDEVGNPDDGNPDDELPEEGGEDESATVGTEEKPKEANIQKNAEGEVDVSELLDAAMEEIVAARADRAALVTLIEKSLLPTIEAQGNLIAEQGSQLRAVHAKVDEVGESVQETNEIYKSLAAVVTDAAMSPTATAPAPIAPSPVASPSNAVPSGTDAIPIAKSADADANANDPTAPAGRSAGLNGVAVREMSSALGGGTPAQVDIAKSADPDTREGLTKDQFKSAFYDAVQDPEIATRYDLEVGDWDTAIKKSLAELPAKWVKAAKAVLEGDDALGDDLAALGADE